MNKKLILFVTIFASTNLASCGDTDKFHHKHKAISSGSQLASFTTQSSTELESKWLNHQDTLIDTRQLLELVQVVPSAITSTANISKKSNIGNVKLKVTDNSNKNATKEYQINSGEYIWPSENQLNAALETMELKVNNEEELGYLLESFELKL